MLARIALASFFTLMPLVCFGQAESVPATISDTLSQEIYGVVLNGTAVSSGVRVYRGSEGTIYVSADDLGTWHLLVHGPPMLVQNVSYYGLQTQLHLMVTIDSASFSLQITAPVSAFQTTTLDGEDNSSSAQTKAVRGGGAFLNYDVQPQLGTYELHVEGPGGEVQTTFQTLSLDSRLALVRSQTYWDRPDADHHRLLRIGDSTTDGGEIGTSVPFAGIDLRSDFSSDPTFLSYNKPAISGVATSQSMVEVYINGVLQTRQDVPAGPFTIGDLPLSAAGGTVTLAITDANGHRQYLSASPNFDPRFLKVGLSAFSFQAGLNQNGSLYEPGYGGAVVSATLRRGVSDHLTTELHAEDILGNAFADAGADLQLSPKNTTGVRIGFGRDRFASSIDYEYTLHNVHFLEQFSTNAQALADNLGTSPTPSPIAPLSIVSQSQEQTQVAVNLPRGASLSASLTSVHNSSGAASALASLTGSMKLYGRTLTMTMSRDLHTGAPDASLTLTSSLGHGTAVSESVGEDAAGAGALISIAKSQRDANDPLSYEVQFGAGSAQSTTSTATWRGPDTTFNVEVQNGGEQELVVPEISGALGFAQGRAVALRHVDGTFALVHLPGYSGVRVYVDNVLIGRTDRNGYLAVPLTPFRKNIVSIAVNDLPLTVDIRSSFEIVPFARTPQMINLAVRSGGGFTLHITTPSGTPVVAGSIARVVGGHDDFPVADDGLAYVSGVQPGRRAFEVTGDAVCHFTIEVPTNLAQVPDLGNVLCK